MEGKKPKKIVIKCDYFCGIMAQHILKCSVKCGRIANCSQAQKVATDEDNQTYVMEKTPEA